MPDENQNSVLVTQTSTSQPWDDFVLDFWEWENKGQPETSGVESHNLDGIEQETEEEMVSTNIDLNNINLFNEEEEVKEEDTKQNDVKIEDEEEAIWEANDDFNISLDDNLSHENNENENVPEQEFPLDSDEISIDDDNEINNGNEWVENDMGEEDVESEGISNMDNIEEEKLDPDDSVIVKPDNSLWDEENNTNEPSLDDNENIDDSGKFDDEVQDDENVNIDNEVQENKVEDRTDDESHDNWFTLEDNQDIEGSENYDEKLKPDTEMEGDDKINFSDDVELGDNNETILSDELINDKEENIAQDEWENNKELESEDYGDMAKNFNENNDKSKVSDDEEENLYDFQENSEDNNENKSEIERDDIDLLNTEWESGENSTDLNSDSAINNENVEKEEQLEQPEIWDLLWDTHIDFSDENPEESFEWNENNANVSDNQEFNNEQKEDDTDWINQKVDSDVEENFDSDDQNFTLDYQENQDESNNLTDKQPNENLDDNREINEEESPQTEWKDISIDQNIEDNNVPSQLDDDNSDKKDSKLRNQEISVNFDANQKVDNQQEIQITTPTLSLDQILDSELTNNTEFADNSKAVPVNVSTTSGSLNNKKLVWVIAWLGVFVLVGVVAVLMFPSKKISKETVTPTEYIEEESIASEHWTNPNEDTWVSELESDNSAHASHPTIQQDFQESEDESEENQISMEGDAEAWEPMPYTCEWDSCFEEPEIQEQEPTLDAETIESKIWKFKSQVEMYYLKWDELQDKKLIRYAAQAIHLCDTYQAQIEKWEWLNGESLSSFNSEINSLINKMEEYLGWDTDIQTFTKSNFDEEYDFPWKEEHKEFIYEMANS